MQACVQTKKVVMHSLGFQRSIKAHIKISLKNAALKDLNGRLDGERWSELYLELQDAEVSPC